MRGLISSRMFSSAGLMAAGAKVASDRPTTPAKSAMQRRGAEILANVSAHPLVHVCAVYL
jgi:hypothetical protein